MNRRWPHDDYYWAHNNNYLMHTIIVSLSSHEGPVFL